MKISLPNTIMSLKQIYNNKDYTNQVEKTVVSSTTPSLLLRDGTLFSNPANLNHCALRKKVGEEPTSFCTISEKFWPMMRFLNLIGFLRISKRNAKDVTDEAEANRNKYYYSKLFSLSSLWTLVMQFIHTSLCTLMAITAYPSRTNWLLYSLVLGGTLQSTVISLTCWLRRHATVKLMNEWGKLERSFFQAFQTRLSPPSIDSQIRKHHIINFYIPCAFIIVTAFSSQFVETEGRTVPFLIKARNVTVIMTAVGCMGCISLLYVICVVMSLIIEETYFAIKLQIEQAHKGLTCKIITNWKRILFDIGDQLQIIGEWESPVGSWGVLSKVFNMTVSLYTLLALGNQQIYKVDDQEIANNATASSSIALSPCNESCISNDDTVHLKMGISTLPPYIPAFVALCTCTVVIIQAVTLIYYVEKIYSRNEKIMTELVILDTSELGLDLKTELNRLIDTLRSKPQKIMYYGTVTVDRKLLLSIFNACITYLIVMLQFKPIYPAN